MDINSNKIVMMDIFRLEKEVRARAAEYLNEITEESLKAFAEAAKYITQSVFENYLLNVDSVYTQGPLKIKDDKIFDMFLDFQDGYRARMKKWALDNEISIREMKIDPSIRYPELNQMKGNKKYKIVIGAGSLVAFGLFVFSEAWIAVAAELLTMGVAAYIYKKNKSSIGKEYAFKIKMFELQIEKEKARLINGLIKDLKTWLENGEKYSNEVLKNIGII